MSIVASDLKWYGSAVMPDDDSVLAIGGAIDRTKKVEFNFDAARLVQAVSSTGATANVTIHYKDFTSAVQNEVKALTGITPVLFTSDMERILKALKSGSTTGDVAVEEQTAVRTGTAQSGSPFQITLDAGASAVDNFYRGMVIRLTAGTGILQIRQIIAYEGATRIATVSYPWAVQPDATSVFRISRGIVFEKSPFEILEVRRPFYNSLADVPGGATRTYYDKCFFTSVHQTLPLTSAQIVELENPSGQVTFALATTANDASTNGAGNNRQVAPSAVGSAFDAATKNVPSNIITSSTSIGVWLKLTRGPGSAAINTFVTMRGTGQTT